ncbi:unnamed protein product, partial [Mesorhabditis belari]|uniref:Uncharacterized protein n=1 Tax=Mesorhabditis belari TaxID=2138241 RepID=A0AAF3F8A0_9BILA
MSRLLSLVLLIATVFVVCQAILPNSPSSDEAPQPNNLLVCEGNCTVASCNACCSGFGSAGLCLPVLGIEWNIATVRDVVWNHAAKIARWPQEHPEYSEVYISRLLVYWGATCENIRNKSLKFLIEFESTMLTAHRYMSFIKMLNAVMSNHNEHNHIPKDYAEEAR